MLAYFIGDGSGGSNGTGLMAGSGDSGDEGGTVPGNTSGGGDCGIYIRKGVLVDKLGKAAIHFCGLKPWVVSSSSTALCSLSGEVPPTLLLAALNGSVVGICSSDSNVEFSLQSKAGKRVCIRQETSGGKEHLALTPCIGLGVVRSIDINNVDADGEGEVHVISPVDPRYADDSGGSLHFGSNDANEPLPNVQMALVQGTLALPHSLLFSPSMPCLPYMTSASAGDGSAQAKARNNVKRKPFHH
jgi:hypothetical protein